MNLLITGGSGTIGNEIVAQVYHEYDRIVIYSRGEAKQAEMKQRFPEYPDNKMRYMIGDVRDKDRLAQAMRGVDRVIHAAAIKRVEVAEYDPEECIKTNVLGAMNVIEACNAAGVKQCLTTSTDKAAAPETLYGSSKLCAERLFVAANNLGKCRFSICRYANVVGSTGSVLQTWKKQVEAGDPITITNPHMTRMWISQNEAALFITHKFLVMQGGEIFVPNLLGKNMLVMARDFISANNLPIDTRIVEIPMRPSEKLHEVLITEVDARHAYFCGDYYVVYPAHHAWCKNIFPLGHKVPDGFTLTSEVRDDHTTSAA